MLCTIRYAVVWLFDAKVYSPIYDLTLQQMGDVFLP